MVELAGGDPSRVEFRVVDGNQVTLDPSGMTATVEGDHLVVVTIRGIASGSYTKSRDLLPGYTYLREAREAGDFEGVMTWALGVHGTPCVQMSLLPGPSRVVIDVSAGG